MTKWLVTHSHTKGAKWRLVEFGGKTGAESYGIVDMIAIRKDHRKVPRGDLFELVLIQVKGGGARMPSAADVDRLMAVKKHHRAKEVILAEWRLGTKLSVKRLVGRGWVDVTHASEVFG
jgi:hypothetical protein